MKFSLRRKNTLTFVEHTKTWVSTSIDSLAFRPCLRGFFATDDLVTFCTSLVLDTFQNKHTNELMCNVILYYPLDRKIFLLRKINRLRCHGLGVIAEDVFCLFASLKWAQKKIKHCLRKQLELQSRIPYANIVLILKMQAISSHDGSL